MGSAADATGARFATRIRNCRAGGVAGAPRRMSLVARQPMGRLGMPEEIAAAVLYVASDAAAFMTGSALVIDGGLTAG